MIYLCIAGLICKCYVTYIKSTYLRGIMAASWAYVLTFLVYLSSVVFFYSALFFILMMATYVADRIFRRNIGKDGDIVKPSKMLKKYLAHLQNQEKKIK